VDMKELSIATLSERIAQRTPMPGGVSACAAVAALAAALVQMGAGTAMKKALDADALRKMQRVDRSAEKLRQSLLKLIQRDSAAFGIYLKALRLPRNTEEEIALREVKKQAALKRASMTPLEVAERALRVLALANMCLRFPSGAAADVLSGALLARAAALGAAEAVKSNVRHITDMLFADEMTLKCISINRNARSLEKSARAAYFTQMQEE